MAVTYTINTRIAGNPQQALAWAAEIATFVQKNHNDTLRCLSRVGGPQGVLAFVSSYEDMGALEAGLAKIQDDSGYWQLINKAIDQGLINMSSTETAIWADLA